MKYKICSAQKSQLMQTLRLVPCLCIIQFNLCWFIAPFAISLNSQRHVLMSWCCRKIYKQSMYCWDDIGNPKGMHGSSCYFAIASETVCLLFTTVADFVCYRWQFAITFLLFFIYFCYSHEWERERINQTQKTLQWLDLIVDVSIAMKLKLLVYYRSWKQFLCSNSGRNLK